LSVADRSGSADEISKANSDGIDATKGRKKVGAETKDRWLIKQKGKTRISAIESFTNCVVKLTGVTFFSLKTFWFLPF
jgi:hypothetical protein